MLTYTLFTAPVSSTFFYSPLDFDWVYMKRSKKSPHSQQHKKDSMNISNILQYGGVAGSLIVCSRLGQEDIVQVAASVNK